MIDKMIRCKNLKVIDSIETIHEWFYKCPPKGKLKHWKDGRSAKETAKHWLHTIPQPFFNILKEKSLTYNLCSPEYVSRIDAYKGEGRNHDLLILAKNNNSKPIVISIESKADEPFGSTLKNQLKKAELALKNNLRSNAFARISELRNALFGKEDVNQLELKYQLLTAVAGIIAEAKKQNAKSAYFLVQTFVEKENNKHKINKEDLNRFIDVFSKSKYSNLENNEILGPFNTAKTNEFLDSEIGLYIGKYEISI